MFATLLFRAGSDAPFMTERYATEAEALSDAPALIDIENAHSARVYRDTFAITNLVAQFAVRGGVATRVA